MRTSIRSRRSSDSSYARFVQDDSGGPNFVPNRGMQQQPQPVTPSRTHEGILRIFDLAIAVPTAIVTAPLLGVAWLAIRLDSPGAVIYRQMRVGKKGAPFTIYKLRTMVDGAERIGSKWATQEGDERITRTGRILRRYSLDELPNLWNVIRGEMSVVGPRPTLAFQVAQYTERQRGRLAVKPGITGWAQINGRASLPWHERIELDVWYVEHRSLRLDIEILIRTAALILRGEGIYRGERGGWHPPSQQAPAASQATATEPDEGETGTESYRR